MTTKFNATEARALVKRLTEFTSKRWHLVPDELGEPAMCIKSDGFDICTAWGGYNRADADAALIAAAPDLHTSLTAALDEIERLETQIRSLDHALNFILSDAAWTPKHLVCESIIACINALRKGDDQ